MKMESLKSWLPIVVLAVGIVGTFVRAEDQIKDNETAIGGVAEDVEDIEDKQRFIEQQLIKQQGDQKVQIQELKGDVKLILRLLEQQSE